MLNKSELSDNTLLTRGSGGVSLALPVDCRQRFWWIFSSKDHILWYQIWATTLVFLIFVIPKSPTCLEFGAWPLPGPWLHYWVGRLTRSVRHEIITSSVERFYTVYMIFSIHIFILNKYYENNMPYDTYKIINPKYRKKLNEFIALMKQIN